MIILYEKNERNFTSLGLGVLRDALSCGVSEGLNDAYELEMEYPIDGQHFNKIILQRIIFAKPNQYDNPQPFRIYNITKPLNGIITINAEHISYDMSGYTVKPFDAIDLEDTLQKIQNGSILPSPFTFHTDMIVPVSMKTRIPYNMRALLAGDSGSVLDIYNGHYKFDKFAVHLLADRGEDRGVVIRYGKNMTELEQEISSEKIYTGIFPFYSAKNTTTQVVMTRFFKSVYEVPTSRQLSVNWFSWNEGGKPFIPLLEDIPVQNKTPGANFNLVYCFKKEIPELVYVRSTDVEYSQTWLSADNDDGAALTPQVKTIYKVVSEGSYQNKNYIWTGAEYELYEGDGFYYIPDPTPEPPEVIPETQTIETEDYIDLSTEEDPGIIYIDDTADPQRILTLDISSEFGEKPTAEVLRGKALDYLLNNDIQELVNSTTVSFIKLADSPEYKRFADLETVKLGDTVKIIYEKLGVEASLQVIKTVFNVITEKYAEIELGKKAANLADSALTKNDSISSLTNDARYTDQFTVKKFIAETITADYIQAKNAYLSVAQIEQLETARIRVTGLIEASMVDIDKIVSRLLLADDADIKNVLTAGEIVVKGTIYAEAGDIGGCTIQDGKLVVSTSISIANETFKVDENGNMIASSVTITGGTLNIGDGAFQVDNNGHLIATSAEIQGDVKITSGEITIGENLEIVNAYIRDGATPQLANWLSLTIGGGALTPDPSKIYRVKTEGLYLDRRYQWNTSVSSYAIYYGGYFKVDQYGNVMIGSGSININDNFSVDAYGNVMIGAGSININDNFIVDFLGHIEAKSIDITGGSITIGSKFSVDIDGNLIASSVTISGGSIDIADGNFTVDNNGNVVIKNGTITIDQGSITIGQDFVVVQVYLVDGSTPFTSGWLSLTDGGSAITPELDKVYQVQDTGTYWYKKYKWNQWTSLYEVYQRQYFHVDEDGNVLIGSGSININDNFEVDNLGNVSIKSGSIDINGNFTVDNTGHLTAKSIDITGGSIQIGTAFSVDIDGNLIASSVTITGGTIVIGDNFSVDSNGNVIIGGGSITIGSNFSVDQYGNVIIGAGSININNKFGVNEDGDVSINGGSINIDDGYTYVDSYIRTGASVFSNMWLSLTVGGSALTPEINKCYWILTEGEYQYKKYKWNGVDAYEPYYKRYFIVDEDGNVLIGGSININDKFTVDSDGNVVAESIILVSGGTGTSVSIDQDGKLRAENAEISGIVTTEDLHTESVIFSDTITVALASESQTISYSYTATGTQPIIEPIEAGYSRVHFGLIVSSVLQQAKTFVVTISYNNAYTSMYYEYSANITMSAGQSKKTTYVDLWDDGGIFNLKKKSVYPSQFIQYVTTGFTALGINSNIIVTGNVLPKKDNTYDIGASDKRWDDVYATNGTIQTSDLRNKKEVNYDISVYNGLFDKLKPVSYKFSEGNRTHLGFIAQDLRDSLVSQGIETQDFAGFIKALKFNSKEKAPEDLTEDDYVYGIRYSELHAMEVQQIQLLKDYIQKLEARIAELEGKIEGS